MGLTVPSFPCRMAGRLFSDLVLFRGLALVRNGIEAACAGLSCTVDCLEKPLFFFPGLLLVPGSSSSGKPVCWQCTARRLTASSACQGCVDILGCWVVAVAAHSAIQSECGMCCFGLQRLCGHLVWSVFGCKAPWSSPTLQLPVLPKATRLSSLIYDHQLAWLHAAMGSGTGYRWSCWFEHRMLFSC